MHARFVLVITTILGAHLANATYHLRGALVTPAPRLHDLNARQADQCQYATDTVCPDGNGCCPSGQPCTVIHGSPACAGTCGAADTICPNDLCCKITEACVLSAGDYYCSAKIGNTFTLPTLTKITYATITFETETFPTESFPTATHDTMTHTVTVSNILTRSSGSSSASSPSRATTIEIFSISSDSTALGSRTAVSPTTTIQSGEAPAASEPWIGIVLSWFTGLLLMV